MTAAQCAFRRCPSGETRYGGYCSPLHQSRGLNDATQTAALLRLNAATARKQAAGAVIERAIAESGLSQTAVAQRAGITQPHLSRICGGRIDPRMSTLIALARALEVTVDEIVCSESMKARQGGD